MKKAQTCWNVKLQRKKVLLGCDNHSVVVFPFLSLQSAIWMCVTLTLLCSDLKEPGVKL